MIWKLEGDFYRVMLPSLEMIQMLKRYEEDHQMELLQPGFCGKRMAIHESNSTEEFISMCADGQLDRRMLSCSRANNPKTYHSISDDRLPVRICLSPLDSKYRNVAYSLKDEYPFGTIIKSGYIKHKNPQYNYSVYSDFSRQWELSDQLPDDLESQKLETWVWCEGYLVAAYQQFISHASILWELLYCD